ALPKWVPDMSHLGDRRYSFSRPLATSKAWLAGVGLAPTPEYYSLQFNALRRSGRLDTVPVECRGGVPARACRRRRSARASRLRTASDQPAASSTRIRIEGAFAF